MIDFIYMGEFSTADFGEGRRQTKRGEKDYVTVKFPNLGTKRINKPDNKQVTRDVAITAGVGGGIGHLLTRKKGLKTNLAGLAASAAIGGGAAYLGSKRGIFVRKDTDGRSDKGKKENN